MELLEGEDAEAAHREAAPGDWMRSSIWRSRSRTHSKRHTPRESFTATSSRRTSSLPTATRPRFSISAWPSRRCKAQSVLGGVDAGSAATVDEQLADQPGIDRRHGGLHVSGTGPRQRSGHAHRSVFVWRSALRDGHWFAAISRRYFGGHFRCDSEPPAGCAVRLNPEVPANWKKLSISCWRKTATCATRVQPKCGPI